MVVLNLIINGLPSKHETGKTLKVARYVVLNLIINGLPSKPISEMTSKIAEAFGFKPYYKWITF